MAVMDELRDLALRSGDAGNARILWMSGPAGAGKSAIAQSFCEECFSTNLLLASFFFNRSDPSRNTAAFFVTTLTYQIYGKVPACYQSLILDVIESDPMVFHRSADAQFKALITDPLQDLLATNYFVESAPALIIIDGLDECSTAPVQVSILTALQNIFKLQPPPFVFIITSRPEHDIQTFFRRPNLGILVHRLTLDDSYCPDVDIEFFLREKLQETRATHPLTSSIPQEWPSTQAIRALVQKSSGQFIYASVVIKYVTSNRHWPPDRLDVVLQLRPPKRDLPFAELDALYSYIFSCTEDISLVLRVLRIIFLFHASQVDILTKDVEELCELDRGECLSALCDLQSVLQVESTIHGQQSIRLLHKSLPDYLQDPARSQHYHINTTPEVVIPILTQSLRCISDLKLDYNVRYASFILSHLGLLVSNIQLCHEDLMSFSLVNCRTTYHGTEPARDESWLREKLLWFAFEFLDKLCTLEGTDYEHVYHHYLHQFPKLVDQFPQVYRSDSGDNRDCIFPMIVILTLLGDSDLHIPPKVFDLFHGQLSDVTFVQSPMSGLNNLSCSAARHCITSLTHESSLQSAAFALECLPLILPDSKSSLDLHEACLSAAPFTFTITQGHGLSRLIRRACPAMHEYRDHWHPQPADKDLQSRPWATDMPANDFTGYMKLEDVARLNTSIRNFELVAEQYPIHQALSLRATLVHYAAAVWKHYADCGKSPEDLDKVIHFSTKARDSWSGEKNIPVYLLLLSTLAGAYFEQYQRAFGPSPIKHDMKQTSFNQAVKYYTELKDNPAAGSQRSTAQVQLGVLFRTRSKLEKTLDCFEIGVQHLKDALSEATKTGKVFDANDEDEENEGDDDDNEDKHGDEVAKIDDTDNKDNKDNEAKQEKMKKKAAADTIKATCLLNLAYSYEARYTLCYTLSQMVHDLKKAINSNSKAKSLLEDLQSPELPACLFNLARLLLLHWALTSGPHSDNDVSGPYYTARKLAKAAREMVVGVDDSNEPLEQRIAEFLQYFT